MQARVIPVVIDRRTHEQPQGIVEPLWQAARQPLAEQPGSGIDVRVHERSQDGVFVRKVLVQRADRDPGALGDPVGGPGRVAVLGKNVSRGIQNPLPGLGGPLLFGLLALPKSIRRRDLGPPGKCE
jgi:hypothetical protein